MQYNVIKAALHGSCVKIILEIMYLCISMLFSPLEQLVDCKNRLNYQVSHV